jgi:hypothetical protein
VLGKPLLELFPEASAFLLRAVGYNARDTVYEQAAEESRRIMGQPSPGHLEYKDDADNRPISLHPMVVPELEGEAAPPAGEDLFDGDLPDLTPDEDGVARAIPLVRNKNITEASRSHKREHDRERESEERKHKQRAAKKRRQKARRATDRAAALPEDYKLNRSFIKNAPTIPETVRLATDAQETLQVSQQAFTASRSKVAGLPRLASLTKDDLVDRYNFLYVDWDGM